MALEQLFDLVTPDRLDQIQGDINWTFCFLCQNDDVNNLQCPHRRTGKIPLSVFVSS